MSASEQYFHFTLGPVQGFVSQARRTRDFWAGSFLLSWLSAVAMKAVQEQTGDKDCILFPAADPNFINWLSGKQKQTDTKPIQGSVPNRFKAKVPMDFEPQHVVQSVNAAWQALADIIFDNDIKNHAQQNPKTKHIWQTQIANSWDISWVLCTDKANSAVVDQRKNCRSYVFPSQAGVKCMMMADWQELSGIPSPHRQGLTHFWSALQQDSKTLQSDLRQGEHLCAIAFVKRRFVRYFHHLERYPMPDHWQLSGWKLSPAMPSVTYMAAAHWLATTLKTAEPAVFEDFYQAAYQLTGELGEWKTRLKCLADLKVNKRLTSLDGNMFYANVLENSTLYPDEQQAQNVIAQLNKLNQHVKEKRQQEDAHPITPASPFYAVLMMDGDSLGKQMSNSDKQTAITRSLKAFTDEAQRIVEENNGFLIYAGGDDVLAILPIEDALNCAKALREHYLACFAAHKNSAGQQQVFSTLSGAIEYAHNKIPLTRVLYDAHHLLDDIAKEKTGRDSIAVRIQKPGGLAVEWSQPWTIALDEKNQLIIENLARVFRKAVNSDPTFSSKFFYKIRERFDILNPVTNNTGEIIYAAVLDEKTEAIDLMCMEYLNSGKTAAKTMQDAKEIIQPLLTQCRLVCREESTFSTGQSPKYDYCTSDFLKVDAALLVRFLANKGIE